LFDVWRYFRHTWITAYQSTPGRKIFVLIRDRAAENHPVIGIAALGSPIVQLSVRDEWIGWTTENVISVFNKLTQRRWSAWLSASLNALIGGVYQSDFIREGHIRASELRNPTEELLVRLRDLASTERRLHRLYPDLRQHKAAGRSERTRWSVQAGTHLFRSKRALALAELLRSRLHIQRLHRQDTTGRSNSSLQLGSVRHAISTVLRYTKAAHVGVDIMDITVCGAIAPYNHVLGGKLVALLMTSPEIRAEYTRRYESSASIIASSMAGRAVVRRPRLVLLGTTSLYAVAPSQYNRLKMPIVTAAGRRLGVLAYERLGRTVGYGSYHFSRATLEALESILARQQHGRPINSIFGEGVNPKLRKIRAALDAVGLPSNELLQHGSPRLVYGIALAKNFREVLLGMHSRPVYVLTGRDATTEIVNFWHSRWLSGRIRNADILRAVEDHTVAGPQRHGARVMLPGEGGRGPDVVGAIEVENDEMIDEGEVAHLSA
jgi:hypothetical protein